MKLYQALLPLAAALAMAGCQDRGKAQSVIGQADKVITDVRDEASATAPTEFKAAEATLAHMKQNFDNREYQAVLEEVPQFNTQIEAMKTAATANQAAAAEWTTLNTEVTKSIEDLQARVDSIKPNALPKDVTKEELETAKTELETIKVTWTEATAAADAGKPAEATEKGRTVQAKANELKSTLGMNEQVASATESAAAG
jgi:predicted  nucleic acid-binding Zn-ribbon protein